MEYAMESTIGYETRLYSTAGAVQFDVPVFDNEISLNPSGLEQAMMPNKKDDPQPQQDPGCDGCKCPKKGGKGQGHGQGKGGGCDGHGDKKDCDKKN